MKSIFTFLLALFFFSIGKSFSQSCKILGCADNYGTQTADGTLPDDVSGVLGGCYGAGIPFKQVFWQFFFSPAGGEFKQAYTPVGSNGLDLDYIVYDLGLDDPGTLSCPIDPEGAPTDWNQIICNNAGSVDIATGPGVASPQGDVLITTASHYYAIAIVFYQSGAGPFSFTVGTPTIDAGAGDVPLTSASCDPIILPVKLSLFNAKVNNCMVNIDWIAAAETDFKSYEVQYSSDGSTFNTIETKPANGANQVYSFQHNPPSQGNIFYRLMMVNIDGTVEYSKTIATKFNCTKSQVSVYPNPVKDKLNIYITNAQDNETRASLFDNNGKLIYSGKLISGINSIDMTKFAKGVYLLAIKNNSEIQNIKIIK